MAKKTIEQVDVAGKRVLMRVDFNVPLNDDGTIADERRITSALPSIRSVVDRGGRLILMSHLGRPKGTGPEAGMSLEPVAAALQAHLTETTVRWGGPDCIGPDAKAAVEALTDGEVLLLENLRFHKAEKDGGAEFAGQLASYGDVYCNDAFGAAHREDASMVAVPMAMGDRPKVAGLLLEKELRFLRDTLESPAKPFLAIIGGAKVSTKIGALRNLMGRVDTVLIGGAMSFTLLKALGHRVGESLVESGMIEEAKAVLDAAAASPTDLILPRDHVCGREMSHITPVKVFDEHIEPGWYGLDIGPETTAEYEQAIGRAKTIVWNGPVGWFETLPFDVGTRQIARAVASATGRGATTVLGGGDTAAAVEKFGLADQYTHVSTGGGASLEMLEGKSFRSVELLDEA